MSYSYVHRLLDPQSKLTDQTARLPWIYAATRHIVNRLCRQGPSGEAHGAVRSTTLALECIAYIFASLSVVEEIVVPKPTETLDDLSRWISGWSADQASLLVSAMLGYVTKLLSGVVTGSSWTYEVKAQCPPKRMLDETNSDLSQGLCLIADTSVGVFCIVRNSSADHETVYIYSKKVT